MAKKSATSRVSKKQPNAQEELANNTILLDELIPVMSLLDFTLSFLTSTSSSGRAKYVFKTFGERKDILYQDILLIIEEYRSFLEAGYFVIMDERVIKRHGLQELVKGVLTKDKIDKILEGSKDAVTLYTGCVPEQRKSIEGMIIRKLAKDPESVDQNLVYKISKESGVDLVESSDDMRLLYEKSKSQGE